MTSPTLDTCLPETRKLIGLVLGAENVELALWFINEAYRRGYIDGQMMRGTEGGAWIDSPMETEP